MSEYSEKLKDPRWQKKRLEILERDNWSCQNCYDMDSTLAVHHKRYFPKTEPWNYPNDYLLTLCEDCHEKEIKFGAKKEKRLIDAVRKNFLVGDLGYLIDAFDEITIINDTGVTAGAISWLLVNKDELKRLVDLYLHDMAVGNG